jgi:membrane fusion protein (multidrug efflux system)
MIKRFLIAIVLLAILVGGLVGFNLFRDQAIENFFANFPVQTVTVSTVTVEEASWTPSIQAIGTVHAGRGVDLTVETAGIVKEVRFRANQRVNQGDILLQLDDAVQQADLIAGQAQAELDRQALQRARELSQRGVGSTSTLQAAEAAAANSTAQLAKLEAVVQQKRLLAPFSGTVGIPRVDPGQYVTPGVSVVTLQDLDTMRADFTVPEQEMANLSIGQEVRLRVDGIDSEFRGKVTGIDPKVDPSSRLVSVRAEIDNTGGRLTPGQFALIRVILPTEDRIIALPQTAVVTSLYGDYVYVVREAGQTEGEEKRLEARQVFVNVGRRNDGEVEIVSGLSVGDVVVTAGQNRLSTGTPVQIDNTIDPAALARKPAAATTEEEARQE